MNTAPEEHMPDEARLRDLLVGKKVVSADLQGEYDPRGYLTLSDGTRLKLWGNEGCGGCSSGWYDLASLNTCDNIITNVEVEDHPDDDYQDTYRPGSYRIFVYADNQRINLASFEGSDGNGYYGTGWWLSVVPA